MQQRLASGWNDFTNSVRAVSRRVPAFDQARSDRRRHRDVEREWDDAALAQGDVFQDDLGFDDNEMVPAGREPRQTHRPSSRTADRSAGTERRDHGKRSKSARGKGGKGTKPPFMQRELTKKSLTWLAIITVVVSCVGFATLVGVVDAARAALDAKSRAVALETQLKGGGFTSPTELDAVQQQLVALDFDLGRIQHGVPLEPALAVAPGTSGVFHVLAMASDFVHAGEKGVAAAQILIPHLKGILSSTDSASSSAQSPPLTMSDIQLATQYVDEASADATAAVQERAQFSDSDLKSIGLGSLVSMVHKLDAVTPQLPTYLQDGHQLMTALPALLGLSKPAHFLMFNLDSDELRATGGFQGNYGLLTLDKGKLSGGIHLHDIISLDCPQGDNKCPDNPPPARFSFADLSQHVIVAGHFQLRDANFDPDFPTTAKFEEQLFQQESGTSVDGVIALTPQVIKDLLNVTGSISIPGYNGQVTAQNLQDTIHTQHIIQRYSGASADSTKAFDSVLGPTLMHDIATLPGAKQGTAYRVLAKALTSHDLMVYLNNPALESVLHSFHADSAINTPPHGDSVFVVDFNNNGGYSNADVKEKITDNVSLDAKGVATHSLTLDYSYPVVQHPYSSYIDAFPDLAQIFWHYGDFVRVIAPANSQLVGMDGCSQFDVTETGYAVWGCEIQLDRGNTLTLHFTWTTPPVVATGGSAPQYTLYVQRQPGTQNAVTVNITPPQGKHVLTPLATPLARGAKGTATFTIPTLMQDETLTAAYGS